MNRREFTQAITVAMLFSPAAFARTAWPFSVGFSLYGMKTLSLNEALQICKQVGFQSIELACMPGWHGDPTKLSQADRKDVVKRLTDLGLTVACLMESVPLDVEKTKHPVNLDRIKRAAELAHDLQMPTPQVESIMGGKPGEWETRKQQFADRLGEWAKLGEANRINMLFKPHRMQTANLPAHVEWLMKQVPSKHLATVFDWSHFEQREFPLSDTLKTLLPLAKFVHIKDTIINGAETRFVLPGQGKTDYQNYFKRLATAKYTGSVCVEVSALVFNQKDYNPIQAAEQCAKLLVG